MARAKRDGIATCELAVSLPILIFLMLGVIETCTVIFLKETLTIAAYEGARVGVRKRGTDADVDRVVQHFLNARGVTYQSDYLEISSPGFDTAGDLEHVSVTVSVPCSGNTYAGWIFAGRNVAASVTMRKEHQNPDGGP